MNLLMILILTVMFIMIRTGKRMASLGKEKKHRAPFETTEAKVKVKKGVLLTIQDNTFHSCRGLKSAQLPSGLEEIGDYAFQDCEVLETVAMVSDSVYSKGTGAFANINSLVIINIPWDADVSVEEKSSKQYTS